MENFKGIKLFGIRNREAKYLNFKEIKFKYKNTKTIL